MNQQQGEWPGRRDAEGWQAARDALVRGMWALTQLAALWMWGGLLALLMPEAHAGPRVLAVSENAYSAPVLVAEAEGYFRDEGLDLRVLRLPIGRLCLEKLLAGEADFATVADTPIVLASFQRRDFSILATTTVSGRENQVVVRNDRGIAGALDLRGKRLGVFSGTAAHYFAEVFLLFHGLSPDLLTEVPLDPKDPAGPLVRGEVDAAALIGTHISEALSRLGPQGRMLPAPSFFSVTFNLVSRSGRDGVSEAEAARLLRAVQRAVALLNEDPLRGRRIVAKALRTTPEALAATWDSFDFRLHLSQPLITVLEAQARWAQRRRLAPAGAMPDYLDLLRPEPLRQLDPQSVNISR